MRVPGCACMLLSCCDEVELWFAPPCGSIMVRVRVGVRVRVSERDEVIVDENRNLNVENWTM